MSNTNTNIYPEVIAQEVLPAFKAGLAPISAFATSYGDDLAGQGDSIRVPVVTAMSASSYTNASPDYETGDTTIAGTQVSLDQHKFAAWHITDEEAGKLSSDNWVAAAREAAYALSKDIFEYTIGLILAATFGDVEDTSKLVCTSADFGADDLATAVTYLKKRNAVGPISAIMDLDYEGALLKDNAVQSASSLGSNEAIREGAVGRVVGANVYPTNGFPTALTDENTGVVVAVPSAIAAALRPVVPDAAAVRAGVEYSTATDPDTGITMGVRDWYNSKTGVHWGAVECLYGAAAVQTAGAVRVVSS